jgi:hypothetical protein
VGARGRTVWIREDGPVDSVLPQHPSLSAVALDINEQTWAACAGNIWMREAGDRGAWVCAWNSPSWKVPFVSLHADAGFVVGVTANGGIVEGRPRSARAAALLDMDA